MQTSESTQVEEIVCKCPHCGASMKMHWHRLSKGLVTSLIKFRKRVLELSRNKVHIKDEIDFTKTEFGNFQKLRYHGFIAKYKNAQGLNESGFWLLTKRGNQFCKNQLAVPVRVQTFRNKISDKSQEIVYLKDILSHPELPYWDERDDFQYDFADVHEIEEIKFDTNGQGVLFP